MSILAVTLFAALLALINIGSSAAFNGTLSLVLEGFYLSYLLAIGLLFWRRIRGDLDASSSSSSSSSSPFPSLHHEHFHRHADAETRISWGPWRLNAALGVANNAIAICYLLVIIFFSFWPIQTNPGVAGMNWAGVVTGAVALFSVL